jgi:hypothetical protein
MSTHLNHYVAIVLTRRLEEELGMTGRHALHAPRRPRRRRRERGTAR